MREKDDKLKLLAIEFFQKYSNPTEDDLYDFLVEKEWSIADNYDVKCHREDIIFELEEREYDVSRISEDIIESILWHFEDQLGNYGNECGWRTILDNAVEWFEEDLEEYKLEVEK